MVLQGSSFDVTAVMATLLGISLATERLVAIVKTAVPEYFAEENKTEAKEVHLGRDRWRRMRVQGVALVAAWLTAWIVAGGSDPLVALSMGGGVQLPLPLVAILCSSGSAFWAQVIGYTSALKDVAVANKASASLDFTEKAQSMGLQPQDSGVVTNRKALIDENQRLLATLTGGAPSLLTEITPTSRG